MDKYLEISFDAAGIRDSQKRLKSSIAELAIAPLKQYQDELHDDFDHLEEIVSKRVAAVIAFWCRHKHMPVVPKMDDKMSDITNTAKGDDATLEDFYLDEVRDAMGELSLTFGFDVPEDYEPKTDELEYALLELEEKKFHAPKQAKPVAKKDEKDEPQPEPVEAEKAKVVEVKVPEFLKKEEKQPEKQADKEEVFAELVDESVKPERSIISAPRAKEVEVVQKEINLDVLNIPAEHAWNLIYGLIGYTSEYVQQQMIPRWRQHPASFDEDRRFLYGLFIDTIRNAAGVQHIAGNFRFADRPVTIDQMWQHYFADLSQKVAPQLATARLTSSINETWFQRMQRKLREELGNMSPVWMLALVIALIFDGLTTYISLDQTPMEGSIVVIFSVLITALFQIADQLVINYRKREFEAEAMVAKYKAQTERIVKTLNGLEITSDSYVGLSMEKSQSHADWKAAEDSLKMAKRGRFWSARIADINILVTAYGFAFLFLNSEEPMAALFEQIDTVLIKGNWQGFNLWVFLMIGLAITISFVVNTAQRTEILGWSMRKMKKDA